MATKKECADFWGNKLLLENIFRGVPNQKGLAEAEAEYSQKCGKYDDKQLKCINLNSQLETLIQLQGASASSYDEVKSNQYERTEAIAKYKKEFNDNDCTKIIEQYRQQELGDVANKFSFLDKARIEEESKYVRNQRIFFGALILLGGVVMITMFGKRK
jgi:Skp family chaperone for outer membrane proteins